MKKSTKWILVVTVVLAIIAAFKNLVFLPIVLTLGIGLIALLAIYRWKRPKYPLPRQQTTPHFIHGCPPSLRPR